MLRRNLLGMLASSLIAAPVLVRAGRPQADHGGYDPGATPDRPGRRPHEYYMRRAIDLTKNVPKYPFGALLVDDGGSVVSEGWNRSVLNPTWHGEMDAINRCARNRPRVDWTRLTLYTTAEPCAMCQGAVAWAGIPRVVFGSSIPYLQSLNWWAIDIRADEVARRTPFRECKVIGGVLEAECNALFRVALRRQ
jgi:tRNA(adenine34) deaminase